MDSLFDQQAADRQTIETLIDAVHTLWCQRERYRSIIESQQINQGTRMEKKIMQAVDGTFYLMHEFEELTKETAEKILSEARPLASHVLHDITMAEKFLQDEAAKLTGQADTSTTGQSTEQLQPSDQGQATPTTDTTPVDQTQTTAVDQSQTAQTDQSQSAPVDLPTPDPAPAAAVDANGNPIQTPPAVDQNQAQPQEQPVIQPLQ